MVRKKYYKAQMVSLTLALVLLISLYFNATKAYAAYPNSKDLFKAHENDKYGVPIFNNKTVTVEGIVTVPSGVWNDSSNYFTIVTPKDSYRFAGGIAVYLQGDMKPHVNIGDRVVVTGVISNKGYSSDVGTTVIKPSKSSDIIILDSGYELPDAFPIYTDPLYEEVEQDMGYRFEGMPVRVLGKVHDLKNTGTVRGFNVDGSRDGNIDDNKGSINVKLYNYSGIDIGDISNGDMVVVEGILFQNCDGSPYKDSYYIRPTKQTDIRKINPDTLVYLSEINRKDERGIPILNGETVTTKGISTVDTGKWNDSSNAYTIVSPIPTPGLDPVYPEGAVYIYDSTTHQPYIYEGDELSIKGVVGTNGYDRGSVVIRPLSTQKLSSQNKCITEKHIYSNEAYSNLQHIESMPVKLQGKVYNIRNSGITRGFDIDASSDYNFDDKKGMISVKFYEYSDIDISDLEPGDTVILRGAILKDVKEEPYTSGYFIRLRDQSDIVKRSAFKKRTLFIHIDAFRRDYVDRGWNTPNLNKLISSGTICVDSYGEYVSMTTPNMTTLVTGSHSKTHNVPALAFYDDEGDRRVRYLQNYDVDTIGEVFQKAGLLTASVKQRKLQNRGADIMKDGGDIAQTRDAIIETIYNDDPDLLVALFNETDSVAHKYGTNSMEIRRTVEEIDRAIGDILLALERKGILENTTIVIASDHGMDDVKKNITQDLREAIYSTGIASEEAILDMGPFDPETKIVFNLASGAAQIYYRLPLTDDEIGILINKLSSIEGVNRVFDRDALDQMNTPANLGDLVVDCKPGYAFSVSKAEHGSYAQTETFMLFSGYNIKKDYIYEETCRNVDIVPTIYYINDLNIPGTVDGKPLLDILEGE